VLSLAFIGAATVEKDVFVFSLDDILDMTPLLYMLVFSAAFYLVITFLRGWNTPGEQRITRLFIGLLVSFIFVEKIVSLSLPYFSNIILGVLLVLIYSEFVTVSIKSIYPDQHDHV
jgi:hypothetical protein